MCHQGEEPSKEQRAEPTGLEEAGLNVTEILEGTNTTFSGNFTIEQVRREESLLQLVLCTLRSH
jgi:hypothetical protein